MDYIHFTFDEISSKYYNLIVQNKGEDLAFPSQPDFENQIVSPLYQGTSFLAGVNKKDRVFSFNVWIDSITNREVTEVLNWLSVDKIGDLLLEHNPSFKYRVKLVSISDFKHMAINQDDTSNYEFSISFTTIEDFAAISFNSYSQVTGLTPTGFSRGYVTPPYDIYFYNPYNLPFYLDFNITSVDGFTIKKDNVTYYSYPAAGNFKLNSRFGFCTDSTGKLIEESLNEGVSFTNLGSLEIENNVKQIYAARQGSQLIFDTTIFLEDTTRVFVQGDTLLYSFSTYNNIINDFKLKEEDIIILNYLKPTKITLSAGITYSFRYRNNF